MKYFYYISIALVVLLLFTLQVKNGSNEIESNSIDVIKNYALNKTEPAPTIQNYSDVNISGITSNNIKDMNRKIVQIESGKVDKAFAYTKSKDYIYDFGHSQTQQIKVDINNSIIHIKNIENIQFNAFTTVLLRVKVKSKALSKYVSPIIKTIYKNKEHTHTFEPGASGIRYLNISALQLIQDTQIILDTKFMEIEDQETELIVFNNINLDDKTIMVIAPHPDDAEIAAYGLYSQYSKDTYIVTVTAGELGTTNKIYRKLYRSHKEQSLAKGKLRTWESVTVPLLGNIPYKHCVNLGFFDGTLKKMYTYKPSDVKGIYTGTSDITTFRKQNISDLQKGLTGGANWESLVNNFVYLLKEIKPDVIITPYPILDSHPDHQFSTIALFEALKKEKIDTGKLYLYSNHYTISEYFPFGKRGDPISLPPEYKNLIYFNNIYSHTMMKHTQTEKMFALNAMSDLRFLETKDFFQKKCKHNHLLCKDYSYVRRSSRDNELFFVVDIKNLHDEQVYDKLVYGNNKKITTVDSSFSPDNLTLIFKLNDQYAYHKATEFQVKIQDGYMEFNTSSNDPVMILDQTSTDAKTVLLSIDITSDKRTVFQLFYKTGSVSDGYVEEDSYIKRLYKGDNQLNLVIPAKYINNHLRVDMVSAAGTYRINDFSIYNIEK